MKRFKLFIGRLLLKVLPLQVFPKLNRFCLIIMGHKVGKNVLFYSSSEILGLVDVNIGNNTFIGHRCLLMGGISKITIGSNCDISSNVALITGTHQVGTFIRRAGLGESNSIHIDNGVWIGYGATILGGVKVGSGSIIAAGSVVISDVPENQIFGGVPAKFIKNLD